MLAQTHLHPGDAGFVEVHGAVGVVVLKDVALYGTGHGEAKSDGFERTVPAGYSIHSRQLPVV